MQCPSCQTENPDDATFCGECGTALATDRPCPSCGRLNLHSIRFCHGCGTALVESSPPQATALSAVLAELPTSFASGRYQVKKSLGEGGKKKVYLTHDNVLDRDVAFSLIKAEGLDETGRTRIVREAQAMGRLGSHPHIVTVFDLGEHEGQPYMVAELMDGGDLEGVIGKATDHKLPLEECLEIAKTVCTALEFAHSKGIVHRDIKPGNVWLTLDGVAKVGDFGLAVAVDRSRLTQEGMMVGTVSYMPPEQALGSDVSPQADLYSLGAMLYEMVTGRPPFLGDDPVAVISQHINTPPVAPTWHNAGCPKPLEALILRLLAKDPNERPGSASDVLMALETVDLAQATDQGTDETPVLDSLAGGIFVGRQKEMGELKAALEEALSGHGRMLTLVGEPGIGKTRTAQELATYAGMRQAQVLWGRCYEGRGVPPYWPWVQAIRSYVREHNPEQVRSEMGTGAADIAEIVSDVKDRLPDLKPPPRLEPEAARFRLFDSITSFLKGASHSRPLVLVLDDLHWADESSLLLLQFLGRELAGSRLLVLGTYRDMELSRQHPLAETLGELTRERLFQRILLRGLSQDDVGRFIEITSGMEPPTSLVETVYSQTEGNPLFVTEVVRLLVQEGDFTQGQVKKWESWTVRIPEGVKEVIGRRLNRLSERCNQTLTTAAVIGREFELKQLKLLIEDLTEDMLLGVLEEALEARIIEEQPQTVGRYQFTHALIQETLVGELSLTRRVRLHASIAEALEKLYEGEETAHATELAYHFGEAQAVLGLEKLVKYSLIAGERALAFYAYEEAGAQFQLALSAKEGPSAGSGSATDEEHAAILLGLAIVRGSFGAFGSTDAATALSRAVDYYLQTGDIEKVMRGIAAVIDWPGVESGLLHVIDKALELTGPDTLERGVLLARKALCLTEYGDTDNAQNALEAAETIASQHKDMGLRFTIAFVTAERRLFLGELNALVEGLGDELEAVSGIRDSDLPVDALFWCNYHMAFALLLLGRSEDVRHWASACVDVAQRYRTREHLAFAAILNASYACLQGDWPTARQLIDKALESPAEHGPLRCLSAMVAFNSGDIEQGTRDEEFLTTWVTGPALKAYHEHLQFALTISLIQRMGGRAENLSLARKSAESVLSNPSLVPLWKADAVAALALLANKEEVELLRECYRTLLPGHTMLACGLAGLTSRDRILGLVSQALEDFAQATSHFEDALDLCLRADYRPELALTCFAYAETLLQRNGPGDREKAMKLLDESLALSRELGMRPLMERVLSRREILGA